MTSLQRGFVKVVNEGTISWMSQLLVKCDEFMEDKIKNKTKKNSSKTALIINNKGIFLEKITSLRQTKAQQKSQ
jgi:hypothetical protein